MNNKKINKESIKVLFTLLNVILYLFLFIFVLTNFYEYVNYRLYGYVIIGFIYLIIFIVFGEFCEIFKLGETTVKDLLLSYSLAVFITNFFIYFINCLICLRMISVLPLLILQAVDCALIAFILFSENKYIRDNYPVPKAVAIVGKNSDAILNKIYKYRDILVTVDKKVSVNKITEKSLLRLLNDYEKVITIDVDHEQKKLIFKECYKRHIQVLDIPSITDMLIASSNIMNVIDAPVLSVNKFGPSIIESFVKRTIDIVGSLFLIILTSPIMLFVSLAIKINDGGDIIFKQKRLTKDERVFEIYKFRSMVMNAELLTGAVLAKENDTRITKVGRFIRKTRFDELPQLFNILKGDMTFVGPRPERPEIYNNIIKEFPEFKYRLVVKAGLTGYAQIYGKYNTTMKDKLLLDLYYIENYKLLDDIKLLVQTLKIIFNKESTEGIK